MRKPAALRPGDRVAAVSLSWGGPGSFPHRYQAGKRQLEETFGVQVIESRHALAQPEWLASHPEARAADLMEAFADPSIQAIVSTIGGDDSIRLLPFLDLAVIRANPKVFLGYSDTTVTHFACLKAGLVSFYGPSIMAGFGENGGLFDYMISSVRKTLFRAEPIGRIAPNANGWTTEVLDWANPELQSQKRKLRPCQGWRWLQGGGRHRGRLIGGCLDVVDWLRGTPVWPDQSEWSDVILFLEISEEAAGPRTVVHFFRALAASGALDGVRGVLFGRPYGEEADGDAYDEAVRQVFRERGQDEAPIITDMDFGHTDPMFVIPYGLEAEIDCEKKTFSILESAVT